MFDTTDLDDRGSSSIHLVAAASRWLTATARLPARASHQGARKGLHERRPYGLQQTFEKAPGAFAGGGPTLCWSSGGTVVRSPASLKGLSCLSHQSP